MQEGKENFNPHLFQDRHLSQNPVQIEKMLRSIGVNSLDELINETVPQDIRISQPLDLGEPLSESELLNHLKELGNKNISFHQHIGLGFYGTWMPPVILRNILENPGWYTQYTPYQAEIAQGRLEALLNFQTLVCDLTGMEVANASLLDESTAAAEAMQLCFHIRKEENSNIFLVSDQIFPQTLDLLKGHAEPLGIKIAVSSYADIDRHLENPAVFGLLIQYPDARGAIKTGKEWVEKAHKNTIRVCFAADLLSLCLLVPPGEWGADIVFGSSQRFGVPMGYGGPHAAYFATKEEFKRNLPGRVIGVSVDAHGNKALRMALQTREQHIRRDKATSNICTAQALPAILASMYAVYHGPQGLRFIAENIHALCLQLAEGLKKLGYTLAEPSYFDTVFIQMEPQSSEIIRKRALDKKYNFHYSDQGISLALDEMSSLNTVNTLLDIFNVQSLPIGEVLNNSNKIPSCLSTEMVRTSEYLKHPIFNSFHTEHELLRYMKKLENKDISLTHSMIPLGSCTMKLNSTAEMMPITWAEWGQIHPFAPVNQNEGYQILFKNLSTDLCKITGFDAFSLQPNSGAQGEYAGLRVIRAYHQSRNDHHRDLVLIPSSAHGTNPASAVVAGFKVMVVACDEKGNIDVEDLKSKAIDHADRLAGLMVTYPSTHGVFETAIREICSIIHQYGGQVYMDGANMNAQVGITSPAMIGADVCHLNLHKTFCIPHGGGGPGMGPIGVAKHLAPFLPGHPLIHTGGETSIYAVSESPWGSASILLISYAYIRLMGGKGLTESTRFAILNANYMKNRLEKYYPVLYSGLKGRSAHELILDCRSFKSFGIEVTDIAKRLMDFGLHAPTVSFPVAGTLMLEPTESESLSEIDRYCDALIQIRLEIKEVEEGRVNKTDNVLKNAPHTAETLLKENWEHPYSRAYAAYPLHWVREKKFWPSVGRINETHGDRVFICTCPPIEEYLESENLLEGAMA